MSNQESCLTAKASEYFDGVHNTRCVCLRPLRAEELGVQQMLEPKFRSIVLDILRSGRVSWLHLHLPHLSFEKQRRQPIRAEDHPLGIPCSGVALLPTLVGTGHQPMDSDSRV